MRDRKDRGKSMNRETEKEIIKRFVKKNKQERLLWELSNPKRRMEALRWGFHKTSIFKESCLQPVKYMDKDVMEKFLLENSDCNEVYFIGEGFGGILSCDEAAERAFDGDICVIYCENGTGYYQGEQESRTQFRFLLK